MLAPRSPRILSTNWALPAASPLSTESTTMTNQPPLYGASTKDALPLGLLNSNTSGGGGGLVANNWARLADIGLVASSLMPDSAIAWASGMPLLTLAVIALATSRAALTWRSMTTSFFT